jgi:hypothetical protein
MKLQKILKEFLKQDKKEPEGLLSFYLNNLEDIHQSINDSVLLKSDIRSEDITTVSDFIRFSCIFNDLSLASFYGGESMVIRWYTPDMVKASFGVEEIKLAIPKGTVKEFLHSLRKNKPALGLGFIMRNDREFSEFLKQVAPFLESGRLLIRPSRAVFIESKRPGKNDYYWKGLEVNPFSAIDTWSVGSEEIQSPPIPIRYLPNDVQVERELFRISMPFIKGISFKDLAIIIDDENDHISGLRSSLKETVRQARKDKESTDEIVHDVVVPRLDKITMRFRAIVNKHRLRISGATLSTAILGYVALSTFGLPAAISAVAGASGLGFVAKEYADYKSKISEVKEDPFYFLWRCREIKDKN